MNNPFRLRYRIRFILGPFIGIGLLVYFSYHLLQGKHSLTMYSRLKQEKVRLIAEADHIKARRLQLERKVSLLSFETLDLDMLDESARMILNLGRENEIIIINPPIKAEREFNLAAPQ